jgi:hypothetical protein
MSSMTTRGASMTAPSTPVPSSAVVLQRRIASLDYSALSLSTMRFSSALFCACFLFLLARGDTRIGLVQFLQEDLFFFPHITDMAQRRTVFLGVFAGVFFADMCQRVSRPLRWTHVTSLSGYGLMALTALWYLAQGKLSTIGLALYAGPFVLSLCLMAAILQRRAPVRFLGWVEDNLLRVISTLFACLAFGLWVQPDAAITRFITERYGGMILFVLIGAFVWGHGQLRHNHLPARQSIRRVVVMVLFVGVMGYFLTYEDSASLLGFGLSVYLFVLCMLVCPFQASANQEQSS